MRLFECCGMNTTFDWLLIEFGGKKANGNEIWEEISETVNALFAFFQQYPVRFFPFITTKLILMT